MNRQRSALHGACFSVLQVGPHICVFKTHVDIFDKWDEAIVLRLQALADKHGALSSCREVEEKHNCLKKEVARSNEQTLIFHDLFVS